MRQLAAMIAGPVIVVKGKRSCRPDAGTAGRSRPERIDDRDAQHQFLETPLLQRLMDLGQLGPRIHPRASTMSGFLLAQPVSFS
jgi:hypothetical protein